jgi:hypothetical protein
MFIQKGNAHPKIGKVWRCPKCGAEWKSTGRHKVKVCLICKGMAWCERHEIRVKRG